MTLPTKSVHVVHMTSVHGPFDIRIFHKECKEMVAAGYRVSLIAPHTASGVHDGVELVAIPPTSSRWRRMAISPARVLRAAIAQKADIYHFHDPELLPVGFALRGLGKRVVYDVHEDVPLDLLHKPYLPSPVDRVLSVAAQLTHRLADRVLSAIVVVTPGVAKPFNEPTMVRNYPLSNEFDEPTSSHGDRPFRAVYVGAIGRPRGSAEMQAVAAELHATGPDRHVVLAGALRDDALEADLDRAEPEGPLRYHGVLDRAGVGDLLDSARVGLFLSQPDYLPLLDAYPNKVFEYMAAGIPIVASDFPVLREIVLDAECGILVDPTDVAQAAEATNWLFDNPSEAEAMGERGRKLFRERYNFTAEAQRLDELYRQLCS
ncbi:MAG: glycosyltransferase family 4 protein [Acidimicrobiales bacterium]